MRALIGTALTPAFPISGFSFLPFGRKRFISFTKRIPLAEAMMNARAPRAKILMVFRVRNSDAWVEQPTVKTEQHHHDVIRGLLPAVLASRVVLPLSFSRLPKKSIPSSGKPDGTMKVVSSKPTIGKSIFSVWLPVRAGVHLDHALLLGSEAGASMVAELLAPMPCRSRRKRRWLPSG